MLFCQLIILFVWLINLNSECIMCYHCKLPLCVCVCVLAACELNTCSSRGTATCVPLAGAMRSAGECLCHNGYTGAQCTQQQWQPCNVSHCYNGGTCVYNPAMPVLVPNCRCVNGYSGINCQSPTEPSALTQQPTAILTHHHDPCFPNPCAHSGLCTIEIQDATTVKPKCQCPLVSHHGIS